MIRFAETQPLYKTGQLIRHRRYGYRGVIVAVDPRCMADAQWYLSNRTQPDQNQPWYHVLVHRQATCTYAAESNLEADDAVEPIEHPLVPEFFSDFCKGCYHRNDREWKGWR